VAAVSSPEDPAVTEVADRKPIDPSTSKGAARRAIAVRPVESDRAPKAIKVSNTRPECEYDDRLRRIIDFRLPDLNGKPVRFQEIDSDLVLIDFWGTWCQPCIRSIPHLVELQQRMGKRLTVVGIACEADAPQASSAKVSETVRRLKVNYPVLLSRNDGSCPLQEALHIQAFPTMILVDRQGRVLWRDQGATPATLARLDRIISSTPKADETRRY
jgi:thiol-disulfide isomerase/thioredoxin